MASGLVVLLLGGCHGKETDEVIAGLRADNERLRAEVAWVRTELTALMEDTGPKWPETVSLKRAGGSSTRLVFRRECPMGQALKGFIGMTGSVIDALVPVCAPVVRIPGTRGARTLERELSMIGGRGGRVSEAMCPSTGLMNGIKGRAADIIDAVQPLCDEGRDGPRLGGEGGRDFERLCPTGWLAVGVTGRQGEYVESLSLICADTRALRTRAGVPSPEDAADGDDNATPSDEAPDKPADKVEEKVDDEVEDHGVETPEGPGEPQRKPL